MSAEDAAKVLGQAERVPDLEADLKAKDAEIAGLKAQLERVQKLSDLNEAIAEKERTLRTLAEEERDAYHARADRTAKEARRAGLWTSVKEWAALGALAGSFATPVTGPLGPVGGAVVGGVLGLVKGLVD